MDQGSLFKCSLQILSAACVDLFLETALEMRRGRLGEEEQDQLSAPCLAEAVAALPVKIKIKLNLWCLCTF
jgi:hypothetical protein